MKDDTIALVESHIATQQLLLNLAVHNKHYYEQYLANTSVECLLSWANERLIDVNEEITRLELSIASAQQQIEWLRRLQDGAITA